MAASARGAKDAGGNTIGVTTNVFKDARPNRWVDEEIPAEKYVDRLRGLVSAADAFVVLEGGIGTLAEATFVWVLAVVGELRKPIVLLGNSWQKAIHNLSQDLLINRGDLDVLKMMDTPEEVAEFVNGLWPDK